MIRVRKLKLSNHPVLGNLELDFTDSSNKAVDTVIIAGNNGIGKSSLVELLYQIMAHKYHDMPCYVDSIEVDFDSLIIDFIRTPPTFIRTCADECGNPIP